MNIHKNITIDLSFERGVHSVARLQKKREGTAIIPKPKSATAKDTTNAFVLVRSLRLLQTRKITNPFTTIVSMLRNQPRTQNHVSIEFLRNGWLWLFNCFLRSNQGCFTRHTGSSKYGTTRKNAQQYYTPKRLRNYIYSQLVQHQLQPNNSFSHSFQSSSYATLVGYVRLFSKKILC